MSSHKIRWLALSSHAKWVFFRLHPGPQQPYITYSDVEVQENNTKPFRALLAMMLATEREFNVPSYPDKAVPLPSIKEEGGLSREDQDERGSDQHHGQATGQGLAVTQSGKNISSESTDLMVSACPF